MRIFKSLEILVSDFAQNLEMGHFNAVRPKARGSEIPTIVLTEVPSYPILSAATRNALRS